MKGFFEFYAREFAWQGEVASVRLGTRARIESGPFSPRLRFSKVSVFNIEDPIDVGRNLNFGLNAFTAQTLQQRIQEAHEMLAQGAGLRQLLQLPGMPDAAGRGKSPWLDGFLEPPQERLELRCGSCGEVMRYASWLEHWDACLSETRKRRAERRRAKKAGGFTLAPQRRESGVTQEPEGREDSFPDWADAEAEAEDAWAQAEVDMAWEQVEAEQAEVEQAEVEQVEAEQVEAEQAEVEQAEAEQVEVEQVEAEQAAPTYECSLCGRAFYSEEELQEHKATGHPKRPALRSNLRRPPLSRPPGSGGTQRSALAAPVWQPLAPPTFGSSRLLW